MPHTILLTDDDVYACGDNDFGQLGLGDNVSRSSLTKVNIPGKPLRVFHAENYNFVLSTAGLFGFGINYGQLGLGDTQNRHVPTLVDFPHEILDLVCGEGNVLILTPDGVYGSGEDYGHLGLGNNRTKITTFTKIPFDKPVDAILCGGSYSLLLSDGEVYISGDRSYGTGEVGGYNSVSVFQRLKFFPDSITLPRVLKMWNGDFHVVFETTDGLYVVGDDGTFENNEFNPSVVFETTDGLYVVGDDGTFENNEFNREMLIPRKVPVMGKIVNVWCQPWLTLILTTQGLFVLGNTYLTIVSYLLDDFDEEWLKEPTKITLPIREISGLHLFRSHLVITGDGVKYVIGDNDKGQLGLKHKLYVAGFCQLKFPHDILPDARHSNRRWKNTKAARCVSNN